MTAARSDALAPLALGAALALSAAAPALAQEWDAVAQFSQTANPSGAWSYAAAAGLSGPVTLLPPASCGWQGAGGYPGVEACLTAWITMAPDNSGNLAVLRWTSPVGGPVRLSGSMAGYWNAATVDGDLHIRHGPTELWSATLRSAPFPAQPFDLTIGVTPGETIDLMIGAGTNATNEWDRVVLVARISGCYANCDASTAAPVLNVADFTCFLQKFAAGEPYANCDASTAPPALNVADFTCFLQRFAAGCS